MSKPYISNFVVLRPPYETSQEEGLEWLAQAHTQSEVFSQGAALDRESFCGGIRTALQKVGCKPEHIRRRGHIIADFLHREWSRMDLYRLSESAVGATLSIRQAIFEKWADSLFEQYYPNAENPPEDLIHVTCTGYVAPSSAQKRVAQLRWPTSVTHAYHMGCYAAIPALRIAEGYLAAALQKRRVDIVHTEGCTLHLNPALHQVDQFVTQSLFADGSIRYSIVREESPGSMVLLSSYDAILPDSATAMTWNPSGFGFLMSLSKEIPVYILRNIESVVRKLGCSSWKNVLFAIHPGGPKIISYIQKALELEDAQVAHSRHILYNYGNMSSATLPHVWKAICDDPTIPVGTPVVSLAFGPGLSIWSALMEKR